MIELDFVFYRMTTYIQGEECARVLLNKHHYNCEEPWKAMEDFFSFQVKKS